jgi:protein SCO1/2
MRTFTTALCLAVALAGLSLLLDAAERAGPPNVAGFLWPEQPQVQPFVLDDARGGSLDQETLRGHWTLLFLGYTHCPDICPTTLATLKAANAALADSVPWAASGQVLFVSVDAERDTPARLKQYVGYFNPAFLAATGTAAQLHLVTTQLDMRGGTTIQRTSC